MFYCYRYIACIVVFLFGSIPMYAQIEKDTLFVKNKQLEDLYLIELSDVWLLPKLVIETDADRRNYLRVRRQVYKVYPFAALASERLVVIDNLLDGLPNKRSKRIYLRRAQQFMQEEFSDTLKSFTRSEGRILFKLIHRQTGYTAFELVKEYRSGWNAFWFNTAASAYDLSMKATYNPILDKEDFYVEDILQRAFGNGRLKEQDPAIPLDLKEIYSHWEIKD